MNRRDFISLLGGAALDLLHRLVPQATRIAVLTVPSAPNTEPMIADLRAGAATLGLQIEIASAGSVQEIDAAFARLAQMRTEAVLVSPSPLQLFQNRRVQLALLAVRHMSPVMYPTPDLCRGWWLDELRPQRRRLDASGRKLCRPHPPR